MSGGRRVTVIVILIVIFIVILMVSLVKSEITRSSTELGKLLSAVFLQKCSVIFSPLQRYSDM